MLLSIIIESNEQYPVIHLKSLKKNKKILATETTFTNTAHEMLKTVVTVQIKSIAQERHVVFSDPDLDLFKADDVMKNDCCCLNNSFIQIVDN